MRYKGDIMKIENLPVQDAKRSIMLKISRSDVKNGRKKRPSECAAALACMRQLHATEARVHLGRTYVRFGNHWKRYLTSKALRSEIVAFDRGGKFEPGDYLLMKMQPSRKGDIGRGHPTRKKTLKRRPRHIITGVRPWGLVA